MRLRRAAASAISAALAALIAAQAAAAPLAPGAALLPAAETARATAVGRIDDVTRLDRSGFAATLRIERVLSGPLPATTIRIAWEELASGRPPRFADGQRVLVALDDLPRASLWRQRFGADSSVLAVAAQGDAYLRDVDGRDLALLAAYLQLDRGAAPAVRAPALVGVVVDATPPVAEVALTRLASMPDAAAALDARAVTRLLDVAAKPDTPKSLRRDIVVYAGNARLAAAAAQLEALARPGAELEAEALTARGEIGGGLPAAEVERLLERPQPALRAVGARFATGAVAERSLPSLVRKDPSPEVRAAAAAALARQRTTWGIDGAIPALGDTDPQVRTAAAQALGALGNPVVAPLDTVARTRPAEARGAITALVLAGPTGIAAVRQLAVDHSDERMRDFARLALGRGPHVH
jgi:hypothetical protein